MPYGGTCLWLQRNFCSYLAVTAAHLWKVTIIIIVRLHLHLFFLDCFFCFHNFRIISAEFTFEIAHRTRFGSTESVETTFLVHVAKTFGYEMKDFNFVAYFLACETIFRMYLKQRHEQVRNWPTSLHLTAAYLCMAWVNFMFLGSSVEKAEIDSSTKLHESR